MTRTQTPATTARQAAEAAYRANPNPATLTALQAAGKAELDEYLAGFDARHMATAETVAPAVARWQAPTPAPLRADYARYVADGLGAELARMAGWAYFDARQYSTARTYFTQALHLAQNLGNRQFAANVLSCMSLQATYEGDAGEAAALARAAQDTARTTEAPELVMAMLHMREAFAHATLRATDDCHRALARSHTEFERADTANAPQWLRYFDETKLIVDTGIARAQLDEHRQAEPLIAEGLRRENRQQQRGRAFHAFWLATTQLHNGALDRACSTASMALDLATNVDSPRIAGHVREFQARLATSARQAPVIAFEAKMREVYA